MAGQGDQNSRGQVVWCASAVGFAAAPAGGHALAEATWAGPQEWAWWALLVALVAGSGIVLILRAVGFRRLSRLWQALAASVMVHVAMTAIMSLVAISRPVLTFLASSEMDEASVNLVVGEEAHLRTQVRYQITELPVADPSLAALMRAAVEAIQPPPFEPVELAPPQAEPHQADLSAEETITRRAPPAVDDRVSLRPPRTESAPPAVVAAVQGPVRRSEPRAAAPVQPAPRLRETMRRPSEFHAVWRETALAAPASEPTVDSITVAAAPQTSPLPQPARLPVPTRAIVEPLPLAPPRSRPPVLDRPRTAPEATVAPVGSLPRRPTGPPVSAGAPVAMAWPHRRLPAEPLGAALSSHLLAEIQPPVAPVEDREPLRLRLAFAPLSTLMPQKIKVPRPITHRDQKTRKKLLLKMGGTTITEQAVRRGLAYLAANQEPDGRWTFIDEDNDQPGRRPPNKDDMGLTGLSSLCFLAAGHRPDAEGEHQACVAAGLDYLLGRQKPTGDLRGDGDMYSHGIAALALGEAAAMTREARYGRAAVKAARFIVSAQERLTGGWRYTPNEGGDTSVLGWQVMALYSASRLGTAIPAATRAGALAWLRSVSQGRCGMLVGYQSSSPTKAMTAEGLYVRLLLAEKLTPAQIAEVCDYLKPPDPLDMNLYGWYYGSLALVQLQNDAWRAWNAEVRDRLTRMQHTGGRLDGSWDASQSRWGTDRGGRIYTTAIATLTLEVYYRYLPMLGNRAAAAPGRPPGRADLPGE